MRTIGVDLAAQPAGTAVCEVDWSPGRCTVAGLRTDVHDADILALHDHQAHKIGIDCPFGWPMAFTEALRAHSAFRGWGDAHNLNEDPERRTLRFRSTDRHVSENHGVTPLSVSGDKIGIVAMRLAEVLSQWPRSVDRAGCGEMVEVYPAAALRRWQLKHKGYKPREESKLLPALRKQMDDLLGKAPWLAFEGDAEERCRTNADCFDALICALVARCAALGRTFAPPVDQRQQAEIEGWIHVPAIDLQEVIGS